MTISFGTLKRPQLFALSGEGCRTTHAGDKNIFIVQKSKQGAGHVVVPAVL
jgi:hypothetical protein